MNPLMLNFLKITPDLTWYDYFLDRPAFVKILSTGPKSKEKLVQLCDQFMDQAFVACNDIRTSKKRRLDDEDIQHLERKREALWRCAWACFAALGCDLEYLLKSSTVTKVYNMLSRLFECAFRVKMEADFMTCLMKTEMIFDSSTVLIAWLCVRLVLLVDVHSRIPKPSVKQTVSNPNNQPDLALIEARQIASFTRNVRLCMPQAVRFMERLLALNLQEANVPMPSCFHVEKPNLTCPIDLSRDFKTVEWGVVKARIECDLLRAHFAAVHLKSTRKYLAIASENPSLGQLNLVEEHLRGTFGFEYSELAGIQMALDQHQENESSLLDYELRRIGPQVNTFSTKLLSKRDNNIVRAKPAVCWSCPKQSTLSEWAKCEPALWELVHCYNFDRMLTLVLDFRNLYYRDFIAPKNMFMSPVLTEVLERHRFHYHTSIFFFMQLEIAMQNQDVLTWTEMSNCFSNTVYSLNNSVRDFMYALFFEVFRVRVTLWNSMLNKHYDLIGFKELSNGLRVMIANSVNRWNDVPNHEWGLNKIAAVYFPFLLNRGMQDLVFTLLRFMRTPSVHLTFARLVAIPDENLKPVTSVIWPYLYNVLIRDNVPSSIREPILNKEQFLTFCTNLKQHKIIKYLLAFLLPMFNKAALRFERTRLPYSDPRLRNSFAFMDKTLRDWKRKPVPDEFQVSENVDMEFLIKILTVLLQNVVDLQPKDPYCRRQLADLFYVMQRYDEALLNYAEVLSIFQLKLTQRAKRESVNDVMYANMTHCLFEKKHFVLACIIGQLRRDRARHLILLPGLAAEVTKTHDAGAYYFRYLYDSRIYEVLSGQFIKFGFNYYASQLVRVTPNKALNKANVPQIKVRETNERRKLFVEVLCRTIRNSCGASCL